MDKNETKIKDIIDWGAGMDDEISRFIDAITKIADGFYELESYDNLSGWGKELNMTKYVDKELAEFDKKYEDVDFVELIDDLEKIRSLVIGNHINNNKYNDFLKENVEEYGFTYKKMVKNEKKEEK